MFFHFLFDTHRRVIRITKECQHILSSQHLHTIPNVCRQVGLQAGWVSWNFCCVGWVAEGGRWVWWGVIGGWVDAWVGQGETLNR